MCSGKPAVVASCFTFTPAGGRLYSCACALRRAAGPPRGGAAPAGGRTGTRGAGGAGLWGGRAVNSQGRTRRLRQPAAPLPLLQAQHALNRTVAAQNPTPTLPQFRRRPACAAIEPALDSSIEQVPRVQAGAQLPRPREAAAAVADVRACHRPPVAAVPLRDRRPRCETRPDAARRLSCTKQARRLCKVAGARPRTVCARNRAQLA